MKPLLKPSSEDDVVLILAKWSAALLYNYPHGVICFLSFIYQCLMLITASYFFLFTNELNPPQIYIMSTFGTSFGFCSYIILYAVIDMYHGIQHDIFPFLWSYSSSPLFGIIQKYAKTYKLIILVTFVLGFICATVQLPWVGNEAEFNFPMRFWLKYGDGSPTLQLIGISISFIQFYHYVIMVLFVSSFMIYMVIHLTLQIQLLNSEITQIATIIQKDSENYNNLIRTKLIECVKHHQLLLLFSKKVNELIYFPIIAYSIAGVLIGIGVIAYFFSKPDFFSFLRALIYATHGLAIGVSLLLVGQDLENESENTLVLLYELPWHDYSPPNRRIVLFFLLASRKHIQLSSSGLISVNLTTFWKVTKIIYTGLSYLTNITRE